MRRLLGTAVVLAALATGAVTAGLGSRPAGAMAPQEQGWWTELNPGPLPEVGQPVTPPAPPDVPKQGLLVEGGTSGSAVAYAALVYYLPVGATASTLTLTIAPDSVTTPDATLEVCPLVNPVLNPQQGGPSSGAPPYSCTHNTSAVPNAKGTAYQFDVSSLVSDGSLAVALLATSPIERVVFSQPGDTTLAVAAAATGSLPATQVPVPATSTFPTFAPSTPSFGTGFGTVPMPIPAQVPAPVAEAPTPTSPAPTKSAPKPYSAIPVFKVSGGANASPLTVALVLAGLVGGAALWFSAGRKRSEEDEHLAAPA